MLVQRPVAPLIFKAPDIQTGHRAALKPSRAGDDPRGMKFKQIPDTKPPSYQGAYINPDIRIPAPPLLLGNPQRADRQKSTSGKDIESNMYPHCKYKFNKLNMYRENVCLYFDTCIFSRN
jgi:hypothetical protein